ncbi:MAG: hypothetical protein WCG66_07230 [bacterium]
MKNRFRKKASALVTTLFVVVVLSTIVMAFMASMSLERKISKSLSNRYQADLAAEAGLNAFLSSVANLSTNYTFNVVKVSTNNSEYLFLGSPAGGASSNIAYTPLFSGGQVSSTNIYSNPLVALTSNLTVATGKPVVPSYIFTNQPSVAWIQTNISTSGLIRSIRYCYTASDLEGGISLQFAGNTNTSNGTHSRASNSIPSSIALFTIFDKFTQTDPGETNARQVIKNRYAFLTPESTLFLNPAFSNKLASLSSRAGEYVEPEVIPVGFQYADEGTNKFSINTNLSSVPAIAGIIGRNLANFDASRRGAFDRGNYTQTLAANIIDYADADSNPTIGTGYRGIDSYPLVTLVARRYAWTNGTGGAGGPIQIQTRTFVNFWNPSSAATSSGNCTFEYLDSNGVIVEGFTKSFSTETFPGFNSLPSIPPNGYLVREVGSTNYSFPAGSPVASPLVWKNMTGNTNCTFRFRWNGQLVDEFRGGAENVGSETGTILKSGDAQRKYKANAAALDYSIGQVGDPRSSFYINQRVFARNYDGSTAWGGRQFSGDIGNNSYKEVRFSRWPDPSNDGPNFPSVTSEVLSGNQAAQASPESPTSSGSSPWYPPANGRGTWRGFGDGTLPDTIVLPTALTNLAPAKISNAGNFTNICELGNIFDPSQWNSITNSSPTASTASGGGYSLRIGQGEFPVYNRPGSRSYQLLDLFTVSANRTNQASINLNTATSDALRALVAGIQQRTNQNLQPTNRMIYAARSSGGEAGNRFAEAVIASRPFLSVAQLSNITNSLGYYFGNTNQWNGNTIEAPTMWSDNSREELFSQIYPLVSVRSRNFLVFVCGQALDANGNVVSSADRVYNVFLEPLQTGNRATIKSKVIYAK